MGTYIRHDKDCNPVTPPPNETDVNQLVSNLTYSIWNKDYKRTDKDCNATTQPNILQGWNADYVRVFIDKAPDTPAQGQVQQSLYQKTSIANATLTLGEYVRSPLGTSFTGTEVGDIIDAGLVLTTEQRTEYLIQVEEGSGEMVITFESNTDITGVDFTI